MSRRLIMVLAALGVAGCSDAFDPTVAGPRPIVVFAVLQSATDTQTVRVHQTMDPSVADPQPLAVAGATVTVTSSAGIVTFQQVDLPGEPGTTAATIPAFRAVPFVPVRGMAYTIVVNTPYGAATGSTVVPDEIPGSLGVQNVSLLEDPSRYDLSASLIVSSVLSTQTLGYSIRLLVEYDVLRSGVWVRESREVPKTIGFAGADSVPMPVYPTLARRTSVPGTSLRQSDVGTFTNRVYRYVLQSIVRDYGVSGVRTVRALVLLHQADKHFFTYFTYANSFQDRFSIRLDQPDYSNVTGALGVFGSLTTDTLSLTLPSDVHTR